MTAATPQGYQPLDAGPITEPTAERFETEQRDELLEPLDYQEEFLTFGPTYHAFVSGIGAGKTTALIQRIALNVEYWNPGETGVVITPTVPSLRNVLIPELRKWGYLDIGDWEPSKKRWTLPNGATVIFESADNQRKIQRLRGPNIGWFGMDEPSSIAAEAWDVMVGRLREGSYLNAFVTGTPKGYNWVYDRFVGDDALGDVNLVRDVTTKDNPHLPDVYTDQIVEQYEGRFYEQEVRGQFTDFEGLVYPWFDADNLITAPPETYDEVVYGVDWGHSNPAVVLAILRRGDQWIVADEWYERRCTTGDQAQAARALLEEYGEGSIYCDPSEPANIHEFKRDYDLPARKAENEVSPGIRKVAEFQDELQVAEHCQNVRNEFSQYQYKDGGDSDDPLKQNDHAMDALRYAMFTHSQHGGGGDVRRVDMTGVF
jgi:PBSX family phage terminase large subunit